MKKYSLRFGAVLIMALSAVVFVTTAVHAFVWAPDSEIAPTAAMLAINASPRADLHPERVLIPSIGVDAATEDLGIRAGSRMAAPASFHTVGWYKYGVAPGQVGTAVMYGHLDNGFGLSGVFLDLHKVALGDDIEIKNAAGGTLRFTVDDIETYPYLSVPARALGGAAGDGKAHIALMTCAGNWTYDKNEGMTYDHRLVVYATLRG
jgi:sortase A